MDKHVLRSHTEAVFSLTRLALPKLNGVRTAEQIREVAPSSKILFLTQYDSSDVIQRPSARRRSTTFIRPIFIRTLCARSRLCLLGSGSLAGTPTFSSSAQDVPQQIEGCGRSWGMFNGESHFCSLDGEIFAKLVPESCSQHESH